MKLRTRIFVVSFTVSATLLGAAIVALTALSTHDEETSLIALRDNVDALAAMADRLEQGGLVGSDELRILLRPIRRDVARRSILEQDRAISRAASWSLFLGAELLAALAVAAIAAAALTSRWARLRDGIMRIRRDGSSEPFFTGAKDEFGLVEEELDRLVEALADKERMRSELRALQAWGEAAAFLTHQARTPLASLSLSTKVVLELLHEDIHNYPEDKQYGLSRVHKAIELIEGETERLSSLFSRVRSLSGFRDPTLVDIDPSVALDEAVLALGARGLDIDRERVTVERSGSGARPCFDRGYLVEAFTNLLHNSLEACVERALAFSAKLRIEALDDEYRIEYTDSVTGIDPGILDTIGSPRFTTKPDGMGLGVWLIGKICGLHGGFLQTDMSEDDGLKFTMVFQIQEACNG